MKKIEIYENRTLKLTNALTHSIELGKDDIDIEAEVKRMDDFIKSKGFTPIGPLIQHTTILELSEEAIPSISLIRQANSFIHSVEPRFSFDSVLRIKNCIMARYIGPVDRIGLSQNKIDIFAFENDIEIKRELYTVFVNETADGNIVADIFVPKAV